MSAAGWALVIFFMAAVVLWLIIRPEKGWWFWVKGRYFTSRKNLAEDILKWLYHVQSEKRTATTDDVFARFGYSRNDLLKLLENLESEGLIRSTGDRLELTDKGQDYALKIIRVHRLWEKYLSEKTGYDKLEWHNRAEQMEHRLTPGETEKLAHELGHPRFDPHGDPIPTKGGELPELRGVPLPELPAGSNGKIVHIEDEPEEVYRQILDKDLHIGSRISVIQKDDSNIHFYSEGESFALSPVVAANITVETLKPSEAPAEGEVRLSHLRYGEKGVICGISQECKGAMRRRLLDLGFVPGTPVTVALPGPLGDPVAYSIRNTTIALRKEQSGLILIKKQNE